MKSKGYIAFFLAALALIGFAVSSSANEPVIIISIDQVESITDEPFYDGSASIDIKGDGSLDGVIHYSYSRIGPAVTCENSEACKPKTGSVLTAYIDLPGGRSHINYMCESIGLYVEKNNGYRDMHCGPSLRLYWDGSTYVERQ